MGWGRLGSFGSSSHLSNSPGRDIFDGGGRVGQVYPKEGADQEADALLPESWISSPARRTLCSPSCEGTRKTVLVMSDHVLWGAATNNLRMELLRFEQGHWGTPHGFVDGLGSPPDEHVDALVCEVHGNADYGKQGHAH